MAYSRHSAIRAARAFACSRSAISSGGQFFSCAGVSLRPTFSAAMRASVKAAKSSAENFGWCAPASSDASGDAAKTVEDRLGKARSAAVAAIRICFERATASIQTARYDPRDCGASGDYSGGRAARWGKGCHRRRRFSVSWQAIRCQKGKGRNARSRAAGLKAFQITLPSVSARRSCTPSIPSAGKPIS